MANHFVILVRRELSLAFIKSSATLNPLAFFIITVSLFPFALGDQSAILERFGGGIIWMAALLASMMSLPLVYEEDYEDGSLEQLLLSGITPSTLVSAKMAAHWLTASLPLIIIAPLLGMMLGLRSEALYLLELSLLAGTPSLTMIGVMSASLTLGLRKSGSVLALLMLPLTVPVLIFGAVMVSPEGMVSFSVTILAGLLFMLLPITIFASVAAIRK
jgi:heme exporter protein B